MTSLRKIVVLACVLSVAASAWAQAAPAKAEPVLSRIPAGTMGFVVVNNVQATAGRIDKLLADLGLDQMLTNPQDPNQKIPVLHMLMGATKVGEGFNPNGGLAAVMLDPKAFDIDLLELIKRKQGGGGGEEEADKPDPKLPFVIYVAGKGVQEVFGAYPLKPAGKYTQVTLPVGPMVATKLGGYVLLSPNPKALDAVTAADKQAAADMPAEQVRALARADLGYYVNMKLIGPIAMNLLKQMAEQVGTAGPMAPLMRMYVGVYGNIIEQLEAVTVTARFVETGFIFEDLVSFRADTPFGKAMAAAKPGQEAGLASLPNFKYALALAGAGETGSAEADLNRQMLDKLLDSDFLKSLPEAEKARLKKVSEGLNKQVTSMQMVAGGPAEGVGLFGVSVVLKCKDAAAVKKLLGETAALAEGMIRHFGAEDEDVQKLTVRYLKGVETVGPVTADAIVVEHPEMNTMSDGDREEMKKVLGEDKIRFLIGAPDAKTVVMTFGGSRDFFAEAVKAARGGGTIGTSAEDRQALQYLPKRRTGVILLNAGNLYDLIVAGMRKMAPDEEVPPFKISCKVPIAIGVGTAGKSAHVVLYLPKQLVKEVAGVVMMFVGQRAGAAPPMEGGNDL
jgi:hypothetical protein